MGDRRDKAAARVISRIAQNKNQIDDSFRQQLTPALNQTAPDACLLMLRQYREGSHKGTTRAGPGSDKRKRGEQRVTCQLAILFCTQRQRRLRAGVTKQAVNQQGLHLLPKRQSVHLKHGFKFGSGGFMEAHGEWPVG